MSAPMTYTTLVQQLLIWGERQSTDANFNAQIPNFIALAENTIIAGLKIEGFLSAVTGTLLVGAPTLAKPSYWRSNIAFSVTDINSASATYGQKIPVLPRSKEYLELIFPNRNTQGQPRFYAEYDANNILIGATPAFAYPFEWLYYTRLQPLDATAQTNWLTVNAPQLMFYACMMQVAAYSKDADLMDLYTTQFMQAIAMLNEESQKKVTDRTQERIDAK